MANQFKKTENFRPTREIVLGWAEVFWCLRRGMAVYVLALAMVNFTKADGIIKKTTSAKK
ncbi:hypothetical protein OM945_07275 [Levilactobacillus namurensis]|nr:hypothetical protein [Levilactobacillus namurensis]MDT7019608.1 hypothetical protein [Levilactobacillus namurensis]